MEDKRGPGDYDQDDWTEDNPLLAFMDWVQCFKYGLFDIQ